MPFIFAASGTLTCFSSSSADSEGSVLVFVVVIALAIGRDNLRPPFQSVPIKNREGRIKRFGCRQPACRQNSCRQICCLTMADGYYLRGLRPTSRRMVSADGSGLAVLKV